MGKQWKQCQTLFFWAPKALQMVIAPMKLKDAPPCLFFEKVIVGFIYLKCYFIYFNWRLITLQYCSSFCHTLTWISHGCTYVPRPDLAPTSLPIPSLWVTQCTSPEHPVSCIEPGLAICFIYGNIQVSMLFSQIIPPLPCPTEFKRLFYTSVSLLLSRI